MAGLGLWMDSFLCGLLPVEECVQSYTKFFQGTALFTMLDRQSGYWEIAMDCQPKVLTVFTTTQGLYQFWVLPFGLKNNTPPFQWLMERVLEELQGRCFLV